MPFQPITAPAASEPLGLATAVGNGIVLNPADPLDPMGNWRKGYTLVGDVCTPARFLLTPRQCDDEGNPLVDIPDLDLFPGPEVQGGDGYPFLVGAGLKCGTFTGEKDLDAWKGQVRRHLELSQWADIANELWTGDKSKTEGTPNKYLASPEAYLVNGTTALPLVDALAQLEGSFASCMVGGPRIIHASIRAFVHLAVKGAITASGSVWRTAMGTLVVTDDGYPGTGPDTGTMENPTPRAAPAAGTEWLYGTGPILMRMDPITFPQGDDWSAYVDYRRNDIVAKAERWVMASWLCCQLAVLATLPTS